MEPMGPLGVCYAKEIKLGLGSKGWRDTAMELRAVGATQEVPTVWRLPSLLSSAAADPLRASPGCDVHDCCPTAVRVAPSAGCALVLRVADIDSCRVALAKLGLLGGNIGQTGCNSRGQLFLGPSAKEPPPVVTDADEEGEAAGQVAHSNAGLALCALAGLELRLCESAGLEAMFHEAHDNVVTADPGRFVAELQGDKSSGTMVWDRGESGEAARVAEARERSAKGDCWMEARVIMRSPAQVLSAGRKAKMPKLWNSPF